MIFEKYKDLTPVQYKGAVEFDEIELKSRVKQFLLYEKSLRNLSQSELEDWLRIFKVSPTQNAQIQFDMDRYQKENKVRFRQSVRLAFAIKKCMKLAYHKADTGKQLEDLGRITSVVNEAPEIKDEELKTKITKKDLLKLK